MDPSASVVSAVNFMLSPNELICWKNSSLYCSSRMTKVSSTNLFHRLGEAVCFQGFLFKIFHKNVGHYSALTGTFECAEFKREAGMIDFLDNANK